MGTTTIKLRFKKKKIMKRSTSLHVGTGSPQFQVEIEYSFLGNMPQTLIEAHTNF